MQDPIAARLREIVQQHGPEITTEPRRVRGLLADLMPDQRREASLLVAAVEEGVPRDLVQRAGSVPADTLRSQLVQRLAEERALARDAAGWAVDVWASALGVQLTDTAWPPAVPPPAGSGQTGPTLPGALNPTLGPPAGLEPTRPRASAPGAPASGGAWRPPPDRQRSWVGPALVGTLVLLLVGAVGVWALLNRDGSAVASPTPTPVAEASPTPTPVPDTPVPWPTPQPVTPEPVTVAPLTPPPVTPNPHYAVLLNWITSGLRPDCYQVTDPADKVDASSLVEANCMLENVFRGYAMFETEDGMYAVYRALRDGNEIAAGQGACPGDLPSERGWAYEGDDAQIDRGRYMCYEDEDNAWLVFTADHARTLAWLRGTSMPDVIAEFNNDAGVRRP